ncbi:DUF2399 domain-containing protein [Streptomyces mirabilis]
MPAQAEFGKVDDTGNDRERPAGAAAAPVGRVHVDTGKPVGAHPLPVRADFDCAVLALVRAVLSIVPQAVVWRRTAASYTASLHPAPFEPGVLNAACLGETPWDPALAAATRASGRPAYEEALIDERLADLRRAYPSPLHRPEPTWQPPGEPEHRRRPPGRPTLTAGRCRSLLGLVLFTRTGSGSRCVERDAAYTTSWAAQGC